MLNLYVFLIGLCLSTVVCIDMASSDCYAHEEKAGRIRLDKMRLNDQSIGGKCYVNPDYDDVYFEFEWYIGDTRIKYCSWQKYRAISLWFGVYPECKLDEFRLPYDLKGIPKCVANFKPSTISVMANCEVSIPNLIIGEDNMNTKRCTLYRNNKLRVGVKPSRERHAASCRVFAGPNVIVQSVKWLLDNKPYNNCGNHDILEYSKYSYYECKVTEDAVVGKLTCLVEVRQWINGTIGTDIDHYETAQCLSDPLEVPIQYNRDSRGVAVVVVAGAAVAVCLVLVILFYRRRRRNASVPAVMCSEIPHPLTATQQPKAETDAASRSRDNKLH